MSPCGDSSLESYIGTVPAPTSGSFHKNHPTLVIPSLSANPQVGRRIALTAESERFHDANRCRLVLHYIGIDALWAKLAKGATHDFVKLTTPKIVSPAVRRTGKRTQRSPVSEVRNAANTGGSNAPVARSVDRGAWKSATCHCRGPVHQPLFALQGYTAQRATQHLGGWKNKTVDPPKSRTGKSRKTSTAL